MWRWLWDASHQIDKSDRTHLMLMFRTMVNARTEEILFSALKTVQIKVWDQIHCVRLYSEFSQARRRCNDKGKWLGPLLSSVPSHPHEGIIRITLLNHVCKFWRGCFARVNISELIPEYLPSLFTWHINLERIKYSI